MEDFKGKPEKTAKELKDGYLMSALAMKGYELQIRQRALALAKKFPDVEIDDLGMKASVYTQGIADGMSAEIEQELRLIEILEIHEK